MKLRLLILMMVAFMSLEAAEMTPEILAADSKLWPREVTVNRALEIPLVLNGQSAGSMALPAGRTLLVKSISAESVTLSTGSSTLTVPLSDTDGLARASEIQRLRLEAPAPTPVPALPPRPTPIVAAPTPTPAIPKFQNALATEIASDLVEVKSRKLEPFDAQDLAQKKYLAVYYSAEWCPPCRAFTPDLVQWVRRQKNRHDNFEVIFMSSDRTAEEMAAYMVGYKMPWPAVDFNKRSNALSKFSGRGIPSLVVLDETGSKVLDSYQGESYIGPRKVLEDFEKLLKRGSGKF